MVDRNSHGDPSNRNEIQMKSVGVKVMVVVVVMMCFTSLVMWG